MAYVRRRGNQLAIVHGERNPETKKVEQRILFTIYSRPEAVDILGRGNDKDAAHRFEMLMKREHPDVTFQWKTLRKAIAADLDHLPESYAYKDVRLEARFRQDLVNFARSLMLADPQNLVSAAALIRENRAALEYLADLMTWRLKLCGERDANQWTADNAFFWRFALQGKEVPPEIEEQAAGLWERRDLVHAEAAFRLLIEAFPDYAEGRNYLGLISLEREDFRTAKDHFEDTVDTARRLLPRRIARSAWWRDHKTRPYMRGLRNLALTHIRSQQYEDAVATVNQLDEECGDDLTATSYRAAIALNTGDWRLAAESARKLRMVWPSEGLIEALAQIELGDAGSALEPLIHAALNNPIALGLVLRLKGTKPTGSIEADDHNTGVHLLHTLSGYFAKPQLGVGTARRMVSDERLMQLMARVTQLRRKWFGHPKADRAIFDELTNLQEPDFAAHQARLWSNLIRGPRTPTSTRTRSRALGPLH